jgi:hypothetical protein
MHPELVEGQFQHSTFRVQHSLFKKNTFNPCQNNKQLNNKRLNNKRMRPEPVEGPNRKSQIVNPKS